ncbi:MAG TPA: hydantoinase/oxoprolinase family protein [Candidatus Limnocylindria bacterium]|nr:hydantoinase/oxoprolinase family protein [Candidatus Limnocylindria bacterium]
MSGGRTHAIGVDIGGTFTDLVLLDPSGAVRVHKVLTTPEDPARAALDGVRELLDRTGVTVSELDLLVHSTTLVTNALLERKGATTALLTTHGFRDVLEMRREQRYDLYDLFLTWPEALVPRDLRLPIRERTTRDGVVLLAPSAEAVRSAVGLALQRGATSIAVSFLHAYANPANERAAAAAIAASHPELTVTLSSAVAPILGEYERTSTAVADAYVTPVVRSYLARMSDALARMRFAGRFFMMLSSGAAASVTTAAERPIRLVESGPAAGAAAAALLGTLAGIDPVLSFDMGGTTAKVCLVERGAPTVVNEIEVARTHRLRRGSGLPLLVPSVELIEIGAGGGSIAHVDPTGLLRVGPSSAGARPGPACYGLGGTDPTVTDANLLLGYLDPAYFLGGAMRLDIDAARRAVGALAETLGLSAERTAAAIHEVVSESMAEAARMHLVERNWDPRKVTMVAFGGAGPAHAAGVARRLGITRVIFPIGAGATSALGSLVAPLSFQHIQSLPAPLHVTDWIRVNALLVELAERGRAALTDADVEGDAVEIVREADMRIRGQVFDISVPIPGGPLGAGDVGTIRDAFGRVYRRLYSRHDANAELEVVNWKVTACGPRRVPRLGGASAGGDPRRGTRLAYVAALGASVNATVYDRYRLATGATLEGPALIEERETTVWIPPSGRVRVDEHLNIVLDLGVV